MELWIFDRSGPYSSGEFDIHKEPERLIRILTGYANMSVEELGLDTYIERDDTGRYSTIGAGACEKETRLQLEQVLFIKQRATVC